jgi:hypothetical protein
MFELFTGAFCLGTFPLPTNQSSLPFGLVNFIRFYGIAYAVMISWTGDSPDGFAIAGALGLEDRTH